MSAAETESTAVAKPRLVSLSDCIAMALQRNLDVQMVRHAPNIARYNLSAAYGLQYDPVFSFSAQRKYEDNPSNPDMKKATTYPADVHPYEQYDVTTDTLETGLSGRGWPGMSYNIGGYSSELYGQTVPLRDNWLGPSPPSPTPVPTVIGGVTYYYYPAYGLVHSDFYNSFAGLNLKQSLLKDSWIDAGRMQIEVNKKNLKISEQTVRMQLMSTILDVQTAYFDLVYANENVKVMEKALALAKELWEGDSQRVKVGTLPPLSEKMAESHVQTAEANLSAAHELLETRRNALRTLLTDDLANTPEQMLVPSDGLVVVPIEPNRAASLDTATKLRPDYLEARLQVERQGIVVRYQYNQMWPALDLTGIYGANGTSETSHGDSLAVMADQTYPVWGIGIQLRVPLGNVQARNKWKASKEMKEQTLLNLKKVEQTIYVQVDDTLKSLKRVYQRLMSNRKATEYAEMAFEAEKRKMADGQSTSFLVSEYESRLIAARTAEILAIVDYNKAVVRLAYNEGSTLEKSQVRLDFK